MEIKYTTKFRRQYREVRAEIRTAFVHTLELFLEYPQHASLRNHSLKERFAGYRSIDVTDDWRALFTEVKGSRRLTITFQLLGTHKQLYS